MAYKKEQTMNRLESENKKSKCPECGGEIVYQENELICKKCGLVTN